MRNLEKLVALMTLAGLTQAELARRVNRHRSLISHVVSGRRRPSFALAVEIERLSEALGVPPIRAVDWLRNPEPNRRAPRPAARRRARSTVEALPAA